MVSGRRERGSPDAAGRAAGIGGTDGRVRSWSVMTATVPAR
jgi:hypothetical protein